MEYVNSVPCHMIDASDLYMTHACTDLIYVTITSIAHVQFCGYVCFWDIYGNNCAVDIVVAVFCRKYVTMVYQYVLMCPCMSTLAQQYMTVT